MSVQTETKIAFLGSGIIAEVWIVRFLSTGWLKPSQVMVCDLRPERVQNLVQRFGVLAGSSNSEGAAFADTIILAVPPSECEKVLLEISPLLDSQRTVISLVAGYPLHRWELRTALGRAIRIMPNAPGQVGDAMNLVAYGTGVSLQTHAQVEDLLNALGRWLEVKDEQMDYWCALCAVGPTYILPAIEALANSAAARGLPHDQALYAAAQMVAGTARMVQHSGKTISQLKQMISMHTLREPESAQLFEEAYEEAVLKLQGLTQRLTKAA